MRGRRVAAAKAATDVQATTIDEPQPNKRKSRNETPQQPDCIQSCVGLSQPAHIIPARTAHGRRPCMKLPKARPAAIGEAVTQADGSNANKRRRKGARTAVERQAEAEKETNDKLQLLGQLCSRLQASNTTLEETCQILSLANNKLQQESQIALTTNSKLQQDCHHLQNAFHALQQESKQLSESRQEEQQQSEQEVATLQQKLRDSQSARKAATQRYEQRETALLEHNTTLQASLHEAQQELQQTIEDTTAFRGQLEEREQGHIMECQRWEADYRQLQQECEQLLQECHHHEEQNEIMQEQHRQNTAALQAQVRSLEDSLQESQVQLQQALEGLAGGLLVAHSLLSKESDIAQHGVEQEQRKDDILMDLQALPGHALLTVLSKLDDASALNFMAASRGSAEHVLLSRKIHSLPLPVLRVTENTGQDGFLQVLAWSEKNVRLCFERFDDWMNDLSFQEVQEVILKNQQVLVALRNRQALDRDFQAVNALDLRFNLNDDSLSAMCDMSGVKAVIVGGLDTLQTDYSDAQCGWESLRINSSELEMISLGKLPLRAMKQPLQWNCPPSVQYPSFILPQQTVFNQDMDNNMQQAVRNIRRCNMTGPAQVTIRNSVLKTTPREDVKLIRDQAYIYALACLPESSVTVMDATTNIHDNDYLHFYKLLRYGAVQ